MITAGKQAERAARREKWRGIIRGAEASGLSRRAYCNQHDVDEALLAATLRLLAARP